MSKLLALLAAVVLCLTVTACGKDACEEAADKIMDCWSSADCNSLSMVAKAACEAVKNGSTSGTATGEGSCDGQAKAAAEEINKCSALDPEKMCAACK